MSVLIKKFAASGLWLEDVPESEVGGRDVLFRILKTVICGMDVRIWNCRIPAGLQDHALRPERQGKILDWA